MRTAASRGICWVGLVVWLGCGGSGGGAGDDCGERAAASAATEWARRAAFYEVFVRSFQDSDGDGVGDLNGLISRLDYLNDGRVGGADLGVDALWLMPIFAAASYHGYDTVDYEAVDAAYGSGVDFDRLIAEAHRRGIRVIVDLVVNHTSDQHPWFISASNPASPDRSKYVWRGDNPGWSQPWGGGSVWHPLGGAFYYGVFWSGMPDLNLTSTAVRDEIVRIARGWLARGVDGFRLDAVRYAIETGPGSGQQDTPETHAWWRDFARRAKDGNGNAFLVGEAWADTRTVGRYYGALDEMDATFDFALQDAIVKTLQYRSAQFLADVFCALADGYPAGALDAVFLGNHDMARLATRLESDPARLTLAAVLQTTLPGTPFLYYGEEIGMRNAKIPADYPADLAYRTPMQWDATGNGGFTSGTPWFPLGEDYAETNAAAQQADPDSLWHRYRRLLAIRKQSEPLAVGDFVPVHALGAAEPAVVSYARRAAGKLAMVVANTTGAPLTGVTLDLSAAGAAEGAVTDLWIAAAATPLSAANMAAYPLGEVPAFGWRLLEGAAALNRSERP
ncbi:MAG: alpha-amylase [Candidatus Schekmanbacteria bacterium]|nr:alpha-amylase [Candidatus Schekmanbacteria bacterium]